LRNRAQQAKEIAVQLAPANGVQILLRQAEVLELDAKALEAEAKPFLCTRARAASER
jgi:hypothetical protein